MPDVLTNRASLTLAAAITSATQTSITRTSAANGLPGDSNGPASGTYKFVMTDGNGNYEIAQVTGGQGTTALTIARAVELIGGVQTALASVPSGTVCYAVATAGDLGTPIAREYVRTVPTIPSGGFSLAATNDFGAISEISSLFRTTITVPASGMIRVRAQTTITSNNVGSDAGLFCALVGYATWTCLVASELSGVTSPGMPGANMFAGEAVLTGLAAGPQTVMLGWATNQAKLNIPSGLGGIEKGTWLEVETLP